VLYIVKNGIKFCEHLATQPPYVKKNDAKWNVCHCEGHIGNVSQRSWGTQEQELVRFGIWNIENMIGRTSEVTEILPKCKMVYAMCRKVGGKESVLRC